MLSRNLTYRKTPRIDEFNDFFCPHDIPACDYLRLPLSPRACVRVLCVLDDFPGGEAVWL